MSKKFITALVIVLTLTIFTIGGAFAATVPTPVLKIDSTVLSTSEKYTINPGKTFNLAANGASKVAYKIANETTQIITGSSTNFTIPSSYTGTGELTIHVCAVASDGTQGQWYTYYVNITNNSGSTTVPTPVLKVDGTVLSTSEKYTINSGKTFNLTATGASKVAYKIGNETTQIITGSSANFTIPSSYTGTGEFTINVCAVASNGTQGQWYTYRVNIVNNNSGSTTVSTPVLKVDGTVLSTSEKYTINSGKTFNLTATGASKVAYKIGNETTQIITGSSANFTIPSSYTGTGEFTINVCAVASNGTQGQWYTYRVNIVNNGGSTTVSTPVLKVAGTVLSTSEKYTINSGKTFNLTANGASKVAYKIGTEQTQIVTGSNVSFSIPSSYTGTGEFTINVCAVASNGTQGQWYTYRVNIVNNGDIIGVIPTISVKVNNAELSSNYTYQLEQGEIINITTTNATKIYYKIANENMVSLNASSTTLIIPNKYTGIGKIAFSVCAENANGSQTGWKTYYVEVTKDYNTVDGTIIAKLDGTTLNTDTTYKVDAEDIINIQVPNANRIYYKFSNGYTQSIVGTNGTAIIPSNYTDGDIVTLSISAVLYDGTQTNWKVYYFQVYNSSYVTPNITVKIGNTTLKNSTTYIVEEGQEIDIYANNASKIIYKIGNSSQVTVNSLNTTITIPSKYTNTGLVQLKVATITNGTQSSWKTYNFEVREGADNSKYPFIILNDEKLNSNLSGLNVSLRTVPLTTKTGNMNYFLLNEYIQYNIDFVNASRELDDTVYIEFVIPSGFTVKFVDTKGATKVNDNKLRWTFDGLERGEKGTIPITLYYTGYPTKNNVAKPYATIKCGTQNDVSAVINMIAKNASTEVSTKHTKFMYGDAKVGTFRPTEGMNRAEVAALLTRVLDLTLVRNATVTYKDIEDFKDPQYQWATQAIMTVTKAGLMEGYEDGTFRPGTKVTKAQLITILARAFALEDEDTKNSAFEIKDEPIKLFNNLSVVYSSYGYPEHWAAKYLAQMIRLNILPEFANTIDGNLDLVITRAEAAKLFCTVLYRGPAVDVTKKESLTNEFVDVTERTAYYEYILEATADDHNSIYQKNGWEKITD